MAEEEVATLKTKITELEEQQKQAYDLLKTLQAATEKQGTPGSEATPPQPETRQLVVVPNEHRLRKFSGRQGENELSIDDFIDNAKSAITSRGLPPPEQANFIFSYLEGPAKEEIKLFPKSDLKEPEKIFALLQQSFGEKRSVPQLLKAFYDRRQREGETLRSYSHALRDLQAKILEKQPKTSDSDSALRDHFLENVRDSLLRKELRKFVRDHPSVSFLDVREEAIRWAEEDEKISAPRSRVVSSQEATSSEQPLSPSLASTMAEIMKTLQGQQKAIEDLASNIGKMNPRQDIGRQRPLTQPQPPAFGNSMTANKCFRCGAANHFARNCPARNQPPPPRNPSTRPPYRPLN